MSAVILNIFPGGDTVRAVRQGDCVYVCIRDICLRLGFLDSQVSYQVAKIRNRVELAEGFRVFPAMTPGGVQQLGFLREDLVQPWFATLCAKDAGVMSTITAALCVLQSDGFVLTPAAESGSQDSGDLFDMTGDAFIGDGCVLIPEFALEIIPVCVWNLLPFAFLFDLCKNWLRARSMFVRLPTRGDFVDTLSGFVSESDELSRSWLVVDSYVQSDGMMDKQEPLLDQYRVLNWTNPYERACRGGLLRIV